MGVILDGLAEQAAKRSYEKTYQTNVPKYKYFYSFVPDFAIDDIISSKAKTSLMTGLNNGYTPPGESTAVASLRERKETIEDTAAPPTTDIDELLRYLHYWVEKKHRPELITKRLLNTVSFCSQAISEEEMKKCVAKIVKATNTFHSKYLGMIDSTGKTLQRMSEVYNDHYVTGETTGLGFGLITSSVSHALLYEAMDRKERDRQIGSQMASAYRASKSSALEHERENFINLESYYSDYSNHIQNAVKDAYRNIKPDFYDSQLKERMDKIWLPVKQKIDQDIKRTEEIRKRELEEEQKKAARSTPEAKRKRRIIYSTIAGVIIVIAAFVVVLGNNNKKKADLIQKALPNHTYVSPSGEIALDESDFATGAKVHIGDRYYRGYVTTDSSPLAVYVVFNWREEEYFSNYSSIKIKVVEINEKYVPTKLKLNELNAFETNDLEFVLK